MHSRIEEEGSMAVSVFISIDKCSFGDWQRSPVPLPVGVAGACEH